jgi:benzoate-CoA ligase
MESQRLKRIEGLPERYNVATDLLGRNLSAGRSDKVAVVDHERSTTYGELAEMAAKVGNLFAELNVERENRILLCLTDTVDFPIAFLGAIQAGIVPVPVNTLLTSDDYEWMLADSRAKAVIVSAELADKWEAIAASNPQTRFLVSGGQKSGWHDFRQLLDGAQASAPADTARDEAAFWLYTSGSTGRPKGAVHTHASLRLIADLYGSGVAGYREDDVVLSVAKLFFAYGLGNSLAFPFAVGATVVLSHERSTPEAISRLIEAHSVSILCGVPTFFAGFLNSPCAPTRAKVSNLRLATSAGECLPPHIGQLFLERYGVDIIDGLGSTEMLHIFLSQRPGEVKYGCTGKPVVGYELRVVDEQGLDAPPGTIGELQIKGPTTATCYWNNRPKSRSTFLGEWMRSGDRYVVDEEGWYTYCGRGDDMLKVGGIYVSPIEVEEVLSCHPGVLEVAVVGAEDDAGLIKPKAFVVLKPGATPCDEMAASLKAHVKERLAPYKYPRWFVFVEELPKTATGKIQRFRLRANA